MDYASKDKRHCWLHHPVIGDVSFDSFIHRDRPEVTSKPPFEWTVNGSLFRDPVTGKWLLQAGLYHDLYATQQEPNHCELYLSEDEGASFRPIGPALPPGSPIPGMEERPSEFPDTIVAFDPPSGKYYMSYDTSDPDFTWERAHDPDYTSDGGSAVAVADRVEGPYRRLPGLAISRRQNRGKTGRFDRLYASTLIRRERDWLMMVLCDSGRYFSWAYGAATAPRPEGPWSDVRIVLSCDREEYYPAPVEFSPAFVAEGKLWAPATSVARSRDYQALFCADLERAHLPEAWSLAEDGSLWHSEPYSHEHYGIWGQTFHGFIHEGRYQVMFPSRDEQGLGTISLASRPWDAPQTDGFMLSGHEGPGHSYLYGERSDFELTAEFEMGGEVRFIFDMNGVIGPHRNQSDSVPIPLNSCRCVCLRGDRWALEEYDGSGALTQLAEGYCGKADRLTLRRSKGVLTLFAGQGCHSILLPGRGLVGLACSKHSWIRVSRWEMTGEVSRGALTYNGWEGLLGAGSRAEDWTVQEEVFVTDTGMAKYNVIADAVEILGPRGPELGGFAVVDNGSTVAHVSQWAAQAQPAGSLIRIPLAPGRHGIRIRPENGSMALTGLTSYNQGE